MARIKRNGSLKDVLAFTRFLEDVSTKIHPVLDEGKIYRVIRREFSRSVRYSVLVLRMTGDGSKLMVAETSLSPTRKTGRKVRLKRRTTELDNSVVFKRILERRITADAPIQNVLEELIPGVVVKTGGKEKRFIITPMEKNREVIGVLAICCPAISKETILSVKTFARHVSTALELADQYADRKRVEDELRSSREQLRNLSRYLQSVREEERSQIAREIHDELGQTITALKLDLLGLKDELTKKGRTLAKKADSMVSLTDRSLQAVHKICGELRPKLLDDLGLAAALEWQVEEFAKRTGIKCTVRFEPQEITVDPDLSITLFRIFQEALTNIARHAGATRVEASLRRVGSKLLLEVGDDGKGITEGQVSHPKSFGLVGMRERIRPHGGELKIRGRRGKGTRVTVTVPLEETAFRPMVAPRMVGREREMRRLKSLFRKAERRDGKLVLIHGEAGIGKTRLVTEFAQDLETRGAPVLSGACREDTRSVPYYPFREAVSAFMEIRKDECMKVLTGLPDYARWEFSRLLPELKGPGLVEFGPAKDHFRLFESFRLFFQNVATQSETPMFLYVEDIHASDDASLELLHYLARNLSKSGVQLCATYRTEEAEKSLQSLTGSLQKEKLSVSLPVKALSSEDVSSMVDLLYPDLTPSQKLRDVIYMKSEGNPFFVQELTKLMPTGESRPGPMLVKSIPKSITSVLQRRIDCLDPATKEVLSCGALVGEEFEFEVLQRALDRAPMEIMEAVEAGARAYIVRQSPAGKEEQYRFIHSLMADILYSGIGKARRKLWHSKVGNALEEHYADRLSVLNGRLTHHFELGENWEKAFSYALALAKHAKDTYASEEAIRHYLRALNAFERLIPGVPKRAMGQVAIIHKDMGDVFKLRGRLDQASAHYEEMRKIAVGSGDLKTEAEALASLGSLPGPSVPPGRSIDCLKRSAELAESVGDKRGIAFATNRIGVSLQATANWNEAIECHEKSLALYKGLKDKTGISRTLQHLGAAYGRRGSLGEALEFFEEALRLSAEIGERHLVGLCLSNIGMVHQMRSSYDEAIGHFKRALAEATEIGDRLTMAKVLQNTGASYGGKCLHEKALTCLTDAIKIYREVGDRGGVSFNLVNLGTYYWSICDYERALGCFREALSIARNDGNRRVIGHALYNMSVLHQCLGFYKEALSECRECLGVQRKIGVARWVGLALRCIGDIYTARGSYDSAMKHLEEALAVSETARDKVALSMALSSQGTLMRHLGFLEEAMSLHKRGKDLASEIGHTDGRLLCSLDLGFDILASGEANDSLTIFNEASTVRKDQELHQGKTTGLRGLCESLTMLGRTQKAREAANELIGLAERVKSRLELARGYLLRARLDQSEEALHYANAALGLFEEMGLPEPLWRAHRAAAQCLRAKGDRAGALKHCRKAKDIIEEIASRISDSKIRKTYSSKREHKELYAELAKLEKKKRPKRKSQVRISEL
jgi:signal transduction histidine kinase/tetratricopeptide (TPR) repeat protein